MYSANQRFVTGCVGLLKTGVSDFRKRVCRPFENECAGLLKTGVSAFLKRVCRSCENGCLTRSCDPGCTRERTLFPRLFAMNLDQVEAQAYFGMKNKTSCSKCVRRKGRSAHRANPAQSGVQVNRLYNIVEATTSTDRLRTIASEKLMRWGFNPKRRCLLPVVCCALLVRIAGMDEVFAGVDLRDKLHGLLAYLFRVFDRVFTNLKIKGVIKKLLEQRLVWVGLHGCLRDPRTKRSYRVQRSLFNAANLGTVDKMCILFLLPHVLGHDAAILPENVRDDILHAISLAQQMIIAVRGNRSYTERELRQIFDEGFVAMFRHLERVNKINADADFAKKMTKHLRNPTRHRAPKRFKRQKR